MKQYALIIEKCGTPGEHVHLLFNFNGDTQQKVKQKIENKAVTLFIKNTLTKTMTEYQKAFDYKIIANTTEDIMYTLGYVYKDGQEYNSKGFTQEYVTKCIQYYHTTKRNEAKMNPTQGWKILNGKTAHAEIQHFATKHGYTMDEPHLMTYMKQNFISFNMISWKQRREIFQEVILSNPDKSDKFNVNLAIHSSKQDANLELEHHKWELITLLNDLRDIQSKNHDYNGLREALNLKISQYSQITEEPVK
jgi:hypothetical protein